MDTAKQKYEEEKIKIIVIEDNIPLAEMLYTVLRRIDWLDLCIVHNAKDFWCNYRYGETGGIILDLNLGKDINDGLLLAEKLRSIDPSIFIFVITGYSDAIDNPKLLNSGVDDFLLKPFEIQLLRNRLFLMFSRLRRWERMRKLYDVNSKYYDEKLNALKEMFNNIKKEIVFQEGEDNKTLLNNKEGIENGNR